MTHTGSALQAFNELCKRHGYELDMISNAKTVEAWVAELRRIDGRRNTFPIINNSAATRLFHKLGILEVNNRVDWDRVEGFLAIAEAVRVS